jgi:hypothetical protein
MDGNCKTTPLLAARLRFFTLSFFAMIAMPLIEGPQTSFALDPIPRSPRVGSLRIPLLSYNRVPISKLLSDPTSYHLREIRIAGTVRTIETQLMTRGCGVPYELTIISLEDESGSVDVLDKGACGRNTSVVRTPMLAAGDRVDLLVQVIEGMKTDEPGTSPEVIVLWIDRTQD